nr:hypothetical protein [Tanacetum cinerariifolium]
MSTITNIRCALTQKAFNTFCAKYHIPEERNSCDWLDSAAITLWMRKLIPGSCIRTERVDMDLFAFIHAPGPTKVNIVERERVGDEQLLLQTIIDRTIPLLTVAPDRADNELETSIDKLFDEGGSGSQAPRHQRKRKTVVVEADGSSHPPKKLREDHGTPSGPPIAGKSRTAVQRLFAGAVLNAEVRGDPIPTLPFVTSSISATPEREGGIHTHSVTGLNLRTISAPQRFVISSNSSHHSGANVAEAEVDSLVRSSVPVMTIFTTTIPTADPVVAVKKKIVKPYAFVADSSFAGGADPNVGVYSDLTESDFLVSGVRTVIDPDIDLQKVYVPQWSVTNGSRLDDGRMSLSTEVRMRDEYNIREKRKLKSVVDEKDELVKARDKKNENLKAQMVLKEAEAAEAIRLRAEASNFVIVENSLRDKVNALNGRNIILEKERNALDVKVADLEASAVSKERELTNLHAQLTSVKSLNDSLADQVASFVLQEKLSSYENLTERLEEFQDAQLKLVISKCLNSSEYLSSLGADICKAIENGMQEGLSARITHGMEGRALTDVAAYNPSAEADYISALQRFQSVNFSLLAELRSNKDASIDTVMNILHLEENLAERLSLTELQPHVDQLMAPIHHSPDKTVIGATSVSFTLDVSNVRVRKIKENIAGQRSALLDVFIHLFEPFSAEVLIGAGGTSDTVSAIVVATMTLSTNLASASTVAPISVDDYVVAGTDDQTGADGNADPLPNVDYAELNIL